VSRDAALWKFRLVCLVIVAVAGGVTLSNTISEALRDGAFAFPLTPDLASTDAHTTVAEYAVSVAPFRSDLRLIMPWPSQGER